MKNQVGVAGRVGFFVSVCKPGLWVGVKTKQEKKKEEKPALHHKHYATPCWQWYTVGFHTATGGGWVHRVNYTSHSFVWFIALITISSLKKKERGDRANKVPRWQRENEDCARESTWVHVRAAGFSACACVVYSCKLLWGRRSHLTVATTDQRWRHRTSEKSRAQRLAPCWWNTCCCRRRPTGDWPNMLWRRIAHWWALR